MTNLKIRAIILFSLVLSFPPNSVLWGQQESDPESSDYTQQLEKRIQVLEQIVKELQRQRPSETPSTESTSQAEVVQTEEVGSQSLVQEPVVDRALKISGLVFGDLYWNAAGHDESLKDRNGFWFRRIYLGFDKTMAEQLDMRLRFEMNSAGDFRSNAKLEPFVKDAYLRWKFTDQHQTYLGLSSTPTWNVVEGFWSYRSLEKTVLDLQRMGASRDLGVAFRGSLGSEKKVRYHLMVGNGSSTRGETNKGKGTSASLGFYPNDSLIFELYSDYDQRPLQADRNTYQVFLGYKRNWGRLGIQYAHQKRKGDSKVDLDVLSLFGFVDVSPRVTLIGRYDRMFDPNPEGAKIPYIPFDPTAKFHFFLAGIDWKVSEGFSLIPNVEVVRYDKREDGTRPDTDLILRITFYYKF
ncbi:MAG: porin [Acidobacteriota bacterium]